MDAEKVTVQQLAEALDRWAPWAGAESWDNVGVLAGADAPFSAVLCALDITPAVVCEAVRRGCGAVVSHHPVIFSPLKALMPGTAPYLLAQHGVAAVCAHTNLDKAAGCDAVSQNPCEILPEYVEAWARMGVKYLLCRSIGYDHIPLETAKKLGMRVAHSHYPPEGVANYAIMLMLMCTRKMNQTMLRAAAQDYTLPGKMGKDLSNCTVGVIGTGKIGRTVIAHLQGFGCKILAYDLYQSDEVAQMAEYVPLDELYARSDVITLHTNATAENHHLINAESLAKMKDGVLIVNTARGALIDEEALIAALESGKVGGAGLDVVEEENDLVYFNRAGAALPHRTMNILRSMPNVIVSPHNAFYTDVNVASMVRSGFEELTDFAAGRSNPCEVPL